MNEDDRNVISRVRVGAFGVISVVTFVTVQAAMTTLPRHHRTLLDNPYVTVVRVTYPGGVVLPEHAHPSGTTLYVYLNDSDGVIFRHSGPPIHVVRRPAVKAGSMRIASGPEEKHTVENLSATASEFLRIQLKKMTLARIRHRLPNATFDDQSSVSTEFVSDSLTIQRLFVAPRSSILLKGDQAKALWIALPSGNTLWDDASAEELITNKEELPMELVRIIVG